MKNIPYLIFFVLGFLVYPLGAFIVAWLFLFGKKLVPEKINVCLLIISMFWGILAFTQKSYAFIDTDCIRYYESFSAFLNIPPTLAFATLDIQEILNFTFVPINIVLVYLVGNVQILSFFWVTVSYMFTYLSVLRLMKFYGCYNQRKLASIILLLTFGFMLFVQISELLKQASAFAVFFYAFTLYIEKGFNIRTMLFLLLSVGIHPSMLMFIPLFIYKLLPTRPLLVFVLILTPILMTTDIITILFSVLPDVGFFNQLNEKYGSYNVQSAATPQYIVIEILMLMLSINLWNKTKENKCYETNIVVLYFIISFSNFGNLIAFLRFALFSHWLFALMFVKYYSIPNYRLSYVAKCIIVLMFLLSFRFTMGRLTAGYRSSYMDNSIVKVVTSTSKHYFDMKYYEK